VITAILVALAVILVLAATGVAASVRVLREYERAVIFRLGRLMEQRGPGVVTIIPGIDRLIRVSLRTITLTVPPQEVITRDNVPARVTAVAYYRVVDPNRAVVEVQSYHDATLQIAQTTLRSVLGGADLDTLLGERERLNDALQHLIDTHTEPWGIKVTAVEIKDVEIPERMQHAIARQAEAERERRAKVINAEGEFQAAEKLSQAADVIGKNPVTIQLRYLQTLTEIGATQNSTVVFPMPIDLLKPALDALGRTAAGADARATEAESEAAASGLLDAGPAPEPGSARAEPPVPAGDANGGPAAHD
jgi:regulator of protease activity HflC (stomatin/prohibitin superfamily)